MACSLQPPASSDVVCTMFKRQPLPFFVHSSLARGGTYSLFLNEILLTLSERPGCATKGQARHHHSGAFTLRWLTGEPRASITYAAVMLLFVNWPKRSNASYHVAASSFGCRMRNLEGLWSVVCGLWSVVCGLWSRQGDQARYPPRGQRTGKAKPD